MTTPIYANGTTYKTDTVLVALSGKGEKISVDKAMDIINNGNIIEWLCHSYPYIDFSLYEDVRMEINRLINDEYLGSISTAHANGIDNNGFCYLITLTADVIYRKYRDEID